MKKTFLLILIIMISSPNYGQKLNGKWILKEVGYMEFKKNPGLQILNFKNDTANVFTNLQLEKSDLNLTVKDSSLILENGEKYADLKLINENLLRLYVNGTFNADPVQMEMNFVKLSPTKTELSQDEIESLSFEFQEKGKSKTKIAFNKELWDKKRLEELEIKEGSKWILEKLDETYLITIFNRGRKGVTLPISEVSKQYLKFYCVPNETGEVIATRTE
ncbi:hypothetical protein [Cellulophaga omnivescoria]|uniref:hypothetical protein n=1 Tax=Cellulophaga omnivescoria TaxID=1888890 RepID=UPI000986320F|nr:hypothetical protein [Cellulophaga omnivescoria]WBU90816.1 hypothetical protein PBN93_07295 [Cellulophaga omnivescoria]WKB82937.1 hypothetical protein QYR09_07825 [Cellulophaga lytica]